VTFFFTNILVDRLMLLVVVLLTADVITEFVIMKQVKQVSFQPRLKKTISVSSLLVMSCRVWHSSTVAEFVLVCSNCSSLQRNIIKFDCANRTFLRSVH